MRAPLRERVEFLVAEAGRRGFFLRPGGRNVPYRLKSMRITPVVVAGARARDDVYTKLGGSFTMGQGDDKSGVSGGVSVYSSRMTVSFSFVFEDATDPANVHIEPFVMENTYDVIPFFYSKADVALNLNVGSILGAFGGQSQITSALLAVLGGQSALRVEASHEVKWTVPVCADTVNARISKDRTFYVFDFDFFKNVLKPACDQYKTDNSAPIDCSFEKLLGTTEKFIDASKKAIGSRTLLGVEGCTELADSGSIWSTRYDLVFVAPAAWGYAPGQTGWVYTRDATSESTWHRGNEVSVIGTDTSGKCGARALGDGEVCVHATVDVSKYNPFAEGVACEATASSPKKLAIAQSEGTDGLIHETLAP